MNRFVMMALCIVLTTLFAIHTRAAQTKGKKIVFIAGKKSHGPGEHEYELGMRLFARCLETSPGLRGYRTEVVLNGWPDNPETLNDADSIVLYFDGPDHNESDDPLLTGDRLALLGRQMKRGCGLVVLHYATFAPVKRGGPEYLDWAGGFFDYETGSTPNHWYSKIRVEETTPALPSPHHPVTRGVTPFPLRDEFYYHIKFRENDRRRTPIMQVNMPDEKEPQTVAWTVQRQDGGRAFSFTGGHSHANWRNPNLRKLILNAIVWTAKGTVPAGGIESVVAPDQDDLRTLILTGAQHPAHDWRATTAALQEILARDRRIKVTVWEDPEKLATEDLSRYDLIIQNYCNWQTPSLSSKGREHLLRFVRNGGGLALIHFANGAWRDWPEYYGGLARRIWVDDKSSHDAFGPFRVHVARSDSPLTAGLTDFDTTDELYCNQQGGLLVDPLLTAHSKTSGKDEPLAFVYTEGKGHIFQTLLGHDANALRTPAHAELIRRACAWAANREILPLPIETRVIARLGEGRFGKALDARAGAVAADGKNEYQEPPLTVECWAKLFGKSGFNVLVANSTKDSPKHWELYTTARSGTFSVYLPGVTPSTLDSKIDIVDGKWHHLAMTFLPNHIHLYIDGKEALDQAIGAPHLTPAVGPLWLGGYPPQNIGCDGLIDEVRISRIIRDVSHLPDKAAEADADVLGLWHFDSEAEGRFTDSSTLHNVARTNIPDTGHPATEVVHAIAPWPVIRKSDSQDWPSVWNDKGGTRFSRLTQINRKTVANLKEVWHYSCGDAAEAGSTIECTPIVIEGVLYMTTPHVRVVALDAATGNEIWKFDPKAGGVNRGVAYWSDGKANGKRRILVSFTNGLLYSLDAKTGLLDPEFGRKGIVDLRTGIERDISRFGYGSSSQPIVFEDQVILGFISSEGGPGAPGDIRAFDMRTGKEDWRFHTVPWPGEPFHETWPGDSWKERAGVNPWSGFTLDEKKGILFCGTGCASSDFYGADRPGNNLFANCTLALDARTGQRLWHFQEVHHDLWDHDNPCPPVLVNVKRNGKTIEAVAQPTKTGFLYIFDRLTGKPLFDVKETPAPSSDIPGEASSTTQPEPVAPPPFSPQGFSEESITNISPEAHDYVLNELHKHRFGRNYLPPSVEGTIVAPGFHGGATWSGASFDPTSGLLFVNSNNTPYIAQIKPNSDGGYDFQGYNYFNDQNGYPASKPPWGLLTAIDVSKGEFVWQIPFGEFPELTAKGVPQTGTENFGGTIVTAGGLVFIGGTKDEKFHAFDSRTGKLLWDVKLPAGGYATPCTYMVNGRQFVVIAAGGGGKLRTKSGDQYVAFALP